jgi:hypothetical protein
LVFMMRATTILALGGLLVTASCLELTYTSDGVPIIPFDPAAPQVSEFDFADATVAVSLEAWTNRMPGPPLAGESAAGFPINVSLELTCTNPGRSTDSLLVPALSLWSVTGDSLICALKLMRTDRRDPWVVLGPGSTTTELTGDLTRLPRTSAAPDLSCRPRLLVTDGGRNRFFSLPTLQIGAVY